RILLGGGADDAVLDVGDAGATAVDRNDGHVFFAANGFERFIGAGRRGLVNGVNDVDHRVLGEQVFHRLAATLLVTGSHVMADNARIGFVAPFIGIAEV